MFGSEHEGPKVGGMPGAMTSGVAASYAAGVKQAPCTGSDGNRPDSPPSSWCGAGFWICD